MTKNELWRLYCEKEREFEKAKTKRSIITIAVFAIVIFLLIGFGERPDDIEIFRNILVSIVLAGIYFVVNGAIFSQLFSTSENERKTLDGIKKRMDEAD